MSTSISLQMLGPIQPRREALKSSANQEFKKRNYKKAIEHYSEIIASDPGDIDVLSTRALAYLKLGLYHMALKDSDAVLQLNQNDTTCVVRKICVIRKIQSLWGLRRYEEALEVLQTQVPAAQLETPKYKELQAKAIKFLKHSKGEYGLEEFLSLPPGERHEIGEYIGPLEIVTVPGKGRGVVATADISAGELVMVTKAFAITFFPEGCESPAADTGILEAEICGKLSLDPHIREEFGNLFTLNDWKPWVWKNSDDLMESRKQIMEVEKRVNCNIFTMDAIPLVSPMHPYATPAFCGIWILLSYFNNDCVDSNVSFRFFGDVVVVRAFRPIKKGDELTISYLFPTQPDRSTELRKRFNFDCNCRLCTFEESEDKKTKDGVKNTLKQIKAKLSELASSKTPKDNLNNFAEWMNTNPNTIKLLQTLHQLVQRIISFRRHNPSFNVALIDPSVKEVSVQLYFNCDLDECVEILEAVRSAMDHSVFTEIRVQQDMQIVDCYKMMEKYEDVRKWHGILKEDLIKAFGSIEMIRIVGKRFLEQMDILGVDFFAS